MADSSLCAEVYGMLLIDDVCTKKARGGIAELGPPIERAPPFRITAHGGYGVDRPVQGPRTHAHQGVDLEASPKSQVLAVGDGAIVRADCGVGRVCLKLELSPPGRWAGAPASAPLVHFVVYADLGPTLVRPGDRVERGQPIALVADRGFVHVAAKRIGADGGEEFFNPALAGLPVSGPLVARNAWWLY